MLRTQAVFGRQVVLAFREWLQQQRSRALNDDGDRSRQQDGQPSSRHRRLSPRREVAAAARMGTPGGVNGVRPSAIVAPAAAAIRAVRVAR